MLALLFGLLAAVGIGLYLYNKPHKDIATVKPDETVKVEAWLQAFNADLEGTHLRYHDKVVELEGVLEKIVKSDSNTWELGFVATDGSFDLSCSLESDEENLPALRQNVTLRCLYVGYVSPTPEFELPGEVKCRSCVWVK